MCGIAGAIALKSNAGNLSDPLDRIVERMSQHLTHRGPDGSGLWNSPSARVVLAHQRLAVIDLPDTGRQPMTYAERFWVTFNGEIYNFKDLRSQLSTLGHSFRGESDTEVLLASIAQWGIDAALVRCVGMFAMAVWDERDQIPHLARDRMGEKPLYIGEIAGYLFFASELRAFRAIPGFSPQISGSAVSAYLRDGCIPGRLSIYEGTYKVPPGHVVTIRAARDQQLLADWSRPDRAPAHNQLEPRRFWSCQAAAVHGRESLLTDERAAIDEGEELLRQSVRMQAHASQSINGFADLCASGPPPCSIVRRSTECSQFARRRFVGIGTSTCRRVARRRTRCGRWWCCRRGRIQRPQTLRGPAPRERATKIKR